MKCFAQPIVNTLWVAIQRDQEVTAGGETFAASGSGDGDDDERHGKNECVHC